MKNSSPGTQVTSQHSAKKVPPIFLKNKLYKARRNYFGSVQSISLSAKSHLILVEIHLINVSMWALKIVKP